MNIFLSFFYRLWFDNQPCWRDGVDPVGHDIWAGCDVHVQRWLHPRWSGDRHVSTDGRLVLHTDMPDQRSGFLANVSTGELWEYF